MLSHDVATVRWLKPGVHGAECALSIMIVAVIDRGCRRDRLERYASYHAQALEMKCVD